VEAIIMTEPKTNRRIVRNRKKSPVPLSKLRTSDVVKTILDHPRRLEELLKMLEDKDRGVRGRAAATLARLSESHPARLLRIVRRLRESLADDSAYVRWHLIYTLGRLGEQFPIPADHFLDDIAACLDDTHRVVRVLAGKALVQIALRKPGIIQDYFADSKREIPSAVARILHTAKSSLKSKTSQT
jgi:hypothetical protein